MPAMTEADQYQEVCRRVHGAAPRDRWHALRDCTEEVGTRYRHAVVRQVYLEVLSVEHALPAPPVPRAWRRREA
jgi:hypothetical protein